MAKTTFIDKQTTVEAEWLNEVNDTAFEAIGDGTNTPTTPAEVRTNIDVNSATDLASTTNSKGASLIGIEDSGSIITATTVEDALQEDVGNLNTHIADTSTHGTTGAIVGATDTQTLTNKTITAASNTLDATVEDIAGLTPTDSNFIVGNGANFITESGATARTSLGLGTAATQNTGTSGANVPLLNGANTWSTNQTLTTGVFFGAHTAADDLLDDYEEGTFTPIIEGTTTAGVGTYGTQIGRYTKIGNRVIFNIYLTYTAHTGTGSMSLNGLPFISKDAGTNYTACTTYLNNIAYTAGKISRSYVDVNSTIISFAQEDPAGAASLIPMDVAGNIMLAGVYESS